MPQRVYTRAYEDADAESSVTVGVSKTHCRIVCEFRRFPVIVDAISGERIAVDAGANFESLIELMRELVVEACDDEASGDRVMLAIIDAYWRRHIA